MKKITITNEHDFAYFSAKTSKVYIKGLNLNEEFNEAGLEVVRLEEIAGKISEKDLEEWKLISCSNDKKREYFEFKVKYQMCYSEDELKIHL